MLSSQFTAELQLVAHPLGITNKWESQFASKFAQGYSCFTNPFALTAEVTAKPTINSNQWQTPVDDEAARQAPRERQRTTENSVSHFW